MINFDNPVFNFLTKVWYLMMLAFYWFICSIPIITIGPATASMYRVAAKVIKKEDGTVTRDFFSFFVKNLKSGIKLTLLHLLLLALLGIFFAGCYLMEEGSFIRRLYLAFGLVLAVVFLAMSCHLYPLFSRFEYDKTIQYIKSSFFLCLRHPIKTFQLVLCPTLLSLLLPLSPVALVLYPSVTAYASVLVLEPVLKQYMVKPEGEEDDETWYWT